MVSCVQYMPRYILTPTSAPSAALSSKSEGSKSSTHYLGDKNRFDVSTFPDEGPLLETSNLFLSPR